MRINELNVPVQPDTYEASMFLTQAIRAGKYAIKIHNLLSNDQELESWVAKKIDLASGYINDVAEYLSTEKVYKEDAGEGHMAKSQLYSVAKSALAITTMVQPGNDIEGWVQTKMNRAVDMLDAVYHYEDYQRLNPYREEIGDLHQKHAEIVKKNIDEILATETPVDDIETKPGMLNILKKRVHQFEKERAQENRKTNEAELDEGLKDWLQRVAASGIIVVSVAGIGSINSAMDNSIPAIQAMNKALDVANQKGDKQTAQMIKHDIDVAKISLDSGKDLNTVRQLQDKYVKFMPADYKPSTPALKFKESFTPHDMYNTKTGEKKHVNNKEEWVKLNQQGWTWIKPKNIKEKVELKPVPSLEASAKKHNVDIETLKKQLKKGIKAESEHTNDSKVAEKIALAHIDERPDYYDQLDKMEKKPIEKMTKEASPRSFKDRIMSKITQPIKDYNQEKESMLPKKFFAGSDKNKLGPAGQLKGTDKRPARAGDLVGEEKQKGLDGKACWKGYKRMGTKIKGGKKVDNCVKYESKLTEKLANKLK